MGEATTHPLLDEAYYDCVATDYRFTDDLRRLTAAYLEATKYPDHPGVAQAVRDYRAPFLYIDGYPFMYYEARGPQELAAAAVRFAAKRLGLQAEFPGATTPPPTCSKCGLKPTFEITKQGVVYRYCDEHKIVVTSGRAASGGELVYPHKIRVGDHLAETAGLDSAIVALGPWECFDGYRRVWVGYVMPGREEYLTSGVADTWDVDVIPSVLEDGVPVVRYGAGIHVRFRRTSRGEMYSTSRHSATRIYRPVTDVDAGEVIHLPGGYQQLIEEPSEARITAHERPSSAVIRLVAAPASEGMFGQWKPFDSSRTVLYVPSDFLVAVVHRGLV